MSVSTNGNNLAVTGDFNRDALQRSCAAIHNLVKQGYKSINIDLRLVSKVFASEMLPFATRCRDLIVTGIDTMLELPDDPKLARLFINSNWAHLIDPRQFEPSQFFSSSHFPAATYKNAEVHFEAVNHLVEKLLGSLAGFSRDQLAALEWAINEITDNVLNHANSRVGGIVQLTTRPKSGIIEFVVCDSGAGIPATLREAHPFLNSDSHALEQAIREGVTRNTKTNMGNGLFGSYRIAELSGGYFSIYSGYALLNLMKNGNMIVSKQTIPYQGTAVVCGINTTNPNILADALSFKGEVYHPANSYVDRLIEGDCILVMLKSETRSFGSRDVAKPVRTKVENLLAASDGQIEIKLDDVTLISSSFADEVFGKLFAQLGPFKFMSRIKITGGNAIVQKLIDRAITQRLALGTKG